MPSSLKLFFDRAAQGGFDPVGDAFETAHRRRAFAAAQEQAQRQHQLALRKQQLDEDELGVRVDQFGRTLPLEQYKARTGRMGAETDAGNLDLNREKWAKAPEIEETEFQNRIATEAAQNPRFNIADVAQELAKGEGSRLEQIARVAPKASQGALQYEETKADRVSRAQQDQQTRGFANREAIKNKLAAQKPTNTAVDRRQALTRAYQFEEKRTNLLKQLKDISLDPVKSAMAQRDPEYLAGIMALVRQYEMFIDRSYIDGGAQPRYGTVQQQQQQQQQQQTPVQQPLVAPQPSATELDSIMSEKDEIDALNENNPY